MHRALRSPLTWMVAAELVVLASMAVLAWHVVSDAPRAAASPAPSVPEATSEDTSLPDIGTAGASAAQGLPPGLNLSAPFWRARLAELNRDQVVFAELEWRIVHTATDVLKRYVESVVLPAIRRAEHAGGVAAVV